MDWQKRPCRLVLLFCLCAIILLQITTSTTGVTATATAAAATTTTTRRRTTANAETAGGSLMDDGNESLNSIRRRLSPDSKKHSGSVSGSEEWNDQQSGTGSKYAYVTLLYNDRFHFATRALGVSIRRYRKALSTSEISSSSSGSSISSDLSPVHPDLVVLVTPEVSLHVREILKQDGWIVRLIEDPMKNPNLNYDDRLYGVFTKLEIFKMVQYNRIVFLDGDVTVLHNVDELFSCPGDFCAVMRHAELINSGVLVIRPDLHTYRDMIAKSSILYSYTGGDQGFFNSYYDDFGSCPYYEPVYKQKYNNYNKEYEIQLQQQQQQQPQQQQQQQQQQKQQKQRNLQENLSLPSQSDSSVASAIPAANNVGGGCYRLPHRYNGDWPFSMMNGSLEFVRSKNLSNQPEIFKKKRSAAIMHFTLGSFKPWMWYSSFLFPFTHLWTDTVQGIKLTNDNYRRKVFLIIALGTLLWFVFLKAIFCRRAKNTNPSLSTNQQQKHSCFNYYNRYIQPIVLSISNRIPWNNSKRHSVTCSRRHPNASFFALVTHVLVGAVCVYFGLRVAFHMIPSETHRPLIGFIIFFQWGYLAFLSTYSLYLLRWYRIGTNTHNASGYSSHAPSSTLCNGHHDTKPGDFSASSSSSSTVTSCTSSSSSSSTSSTLSHMSFQKALLESTILFSILLFIAVRFAYSRTTVISTSLGQVLVPVIIFVVEVVIILVLLFVRLPYVWFLHGKQQAKLKFSGV